MTQVHPVTDTVIGLLHDCTSVGPVYSFECLKRLNKQEKKIIKFFLII